MNFLRKNLVLLTKSNAFSWSALLALSAFISKIFGLWRDRLLVQFFAENNQLDLVFAAFRIPDFFFFLLISGTVATLFIPRYADLSSDEDQISFFQSFLVLFISFFGLVCLVGILTTPWLAQIFSPGLDTFAQVEIASLSRYLFGSVFLLCISSVLSAQLQAEKKFLSIAIAPIAYMLGLCLGILYWNETLGIKAVGYGAILGSALHLGLNVVAVKQNNPKQLVFKKSLKFLLKPTNAWYRFRSDFLVRVLNGSAFQINQTIDVIIASFLGSGSIAAFSLGTTLGHFLLSVVGFSVAKVLFPALSEAKHNWETQINIIKKGMILVLGITIPASIIAFAGSEWLLQTFLTLSGEKLRLTNIVFTWTVLSLPAACIIPLLSRFFLANDFPKTPLKSAVIALIIATTIAAVLSLIVLPKNEAIIGLAIGNFVANYLNAGLLVFQLYLKKTKQAVKFCQRNK